jgi:hypothetical protein
MNNWQAPLIVAILGTVLAIAAAEPAAGLIAWGIAILGYAINKAGN